MDQKGAAQLPLYHEEPVRMVVVTKEKRHQGAVLMAFMLGCLSMLLFVGGMNYGSMCWDMLTEYTSTPSSAAPTPEEEFPYRNPATWDIEAGHTRTVSYMVDEATWMNVDVSPDGSTLLFDVLGDLYTLPISGGQAKLLKGGVSFDRQARYSPDGTKIVYTSDASGCDNLWVLDLATQATFPVTSEPYRFVSNGMWAPNGTTVTGVKWYTSQRSLGAGEIWAFSVNPAAPDAGHRLVGRPSFDNQIGPEEPVYSRDGRSIYYSKNTADSSVFQYSKDPNKGIYSVFRYDSQTASSTVISSGPGGAARPIISHGGNTLAFVRRTLFNNSLVIMDLATGNEKVVFHQLSFDQQASSAPSGVYPSFAWLKGDVEVVLWALGKLWRVNTQTGAKTNIPFTLNVSLQLASTVRAPYNPSTGSSFKTKVAQGASHSRTAILFNTLGRSYKMPLPSGTASLLVPNRQTSVEFESGVSASPNGLQAVQVVWNDETLARVELVTIDNPSKPLTLTTATGRYGFPSFSPTGNKVVFSRFSGDSLSGPLYGLGSGIYVVNLVMGSDGLLAIDAAEPTYVTSGYRATFANDGNSLLVERDGGVTQVYLDGSQADRALVKCSYCTSISVSPDLALVAFIDLYELYLAPLQVSGNLPLEISTKPGYTPTGMRRLSPNGGDYLSWPPEGGIKALNWMTGPVLYTVVPDDLVGCTADESNDYGLACVQALTTATDLSMTAQTNIPQTSIVLDNAVLVTMTGDEATSVIPDGRIVILGDKIQSLGPRSEVPIPGGAQVIDVEGGVVMPGLIDAHAHWSSTSGYWVQQSWEFVVNLAFGVTTMHNPSYDTVYGFSDAELVRSGLKLGPRLFLTGTIIYGAAGSYRCEIDDLDAARATLRRLKAYGAFSVKSYNQPCRSTRQMILEAARELEMSVVPEGGMAFHWNLNQIIDGHTTIEHSLPVAPLYNDITELFARSGTAYTPTLIVSYGGIYGENYWYQHTNVWENERLMKFSPHRDIISRSAQRPKAEDEDYHHFAVTKSARVINDKGGLTLAGAHGQRQGIGMHWEMWMFAQGGMSNYNSLKSATANVAAGLGLQNLGKLAPGYLADIIVYPPTASPLEDIYNSEKVLYVLKDGRLYEAATMDQLLPEFKPLPKGPVLNIPENDL